MSFLAVQWALNWAPCQTSYERLVLIKLAEHANDDGTDSWPAIDTIADAAHCSRRTVQRHLAALEKRGIIAPGNQNANTHIRPDRRPKVWDLLIPRSWFSDDQWHKIQLDRVRRGQEPLNETARPDLNQPASETEPARSTGCHSDTPQAERGVTESPREGHGVSESHPAPGPRGVTVSRTGCQSDTRTSPINQSFKRSLARSLSEYSPQSGEIARDARAHAHAYAPQPTPQPEPEPSAGAPQLTLIPGITEPAKTTTPKRKTTGRQRGEYTPEFEEFWKLYGRRGTKGDAAREFTKALERVDLDTLMQAVRAYLAYEPNPRYRKHAERWLAKDGWASDYSTPAPSDDGYRPYRNSDYSDADRLKGFWG